MMLVVLMMFSSPRPHTTRMAMTRFNDARSVDDVFQVKDIEYKTGYLQLPEITELVENVTSDRSRVSEHLHRT